MSWFSNHKVIRVGFVITCIEFNEVYSMFHLLPVFALKFWIGKPEAIRIGWGKWIVEFYF